MGQVDTAGHLSPKGKVGDSSSERLWYEPGMAHEGYHEPAELLSEDTKDMHRALVSLQEELEAVDWYQQRADGTNEPELKAILVHNKNEEIEHAMMVLEWIRRRNPKFDANIHTYLMKEGPITELEAAEKAGEAGGGSENGKSSSASATSPQGAFGSLGIGSLKGK